MGSEEISRPANGMTGLFTGEHTISEVLAQLRMRLLDLTARNRLLNFRHSQTKTIQVVDVVADVVYDRLIDGRALTFIPVPDPRQSEYEGEDRNQKPDVRDYAKKLGIGTNYELPHGRRDVPARGSEGMRLRVLSYPEGTERLCRRVSKEARSAIEETGTNMLYLVFGFLEFYESEQSERALLAPLIAVPVSMKKGTVDKESRLPLYDITYTGDEVVENLSLREKLRAEFAMELPRIEEDERPEDYFERVADAIETRPRWKVRRQITLALLSFAKMLLINDLDPKNWPRGLSRSELEEHNVVRTVFGDLTEDEGAGIEPPDYDVDNHDKNNLSLIYDADTSQHSALIDALEGKNLVVNGPPGTGKSQSITNLVAESLVNGKKVLFVSEKLAALQVVKNRLEQAKLGQFCLELHSHKAQKKRLLEDISERISSRYREPAGFESKLQLLEQHKKQLKFYADLMNSNVGNELELTVFEILWRAERYRQTAREGAAAVEDIVVEDAPNCNAVRLGEMRGAIQALAGHFAEVGNFDNSHPWFGFFPTELRPGDDLQIETALNALVERTNGVDVAAHQVKALAGLAELPDDMASQVSLATILEELPAPTEAVSGTLLPRLFLPDAGGGAEAVRIVQLLKARIEKARRLTEETKGTIRQDAPHEPQTLAKAQEWRQKLAQHGADGLTIKQLNSHAEELTQLLVGISNSLAFFSDLANQLPFVRGQTDSGLRKAFAILRVCGEAPRNLLEYRAASFARASTKELLAQGNKEQSRLAQMRADMSQAFHLDTAPNSESIVSVINVYREGDRWYRGLQGRWRRARKFYRSLAKDGARRPAAECEEELTKLHQFLRDSQSYQEDSTYREVFGRLFKGHETDYEKIGQLVSWYEHAQEVMAAAAVTPAEFDITTRPEYEIQQLASHYALGQAHSKALANALGRLIALSEKSRVAGAIRGAHHSWERRLEGAGVLRADYSEAARFFGSIGPENLSANELVRLLSECLELRALVKSIEQDDDVRKILGGHYRGLDTDLSIIEQTLAWGHAIAATRLPETIHYVLLSEGALTLLPKLQASAAELNGAWDSVTDFASEMLQFGAFDWDKWNSASVAKPGKETTEVIRSRAHVALSNFDSLLSWAQYLYARESVSAFGLGRFVKRLEEGRVSHELLISSFLYRVHASIAQSLFRSNPTLGRFSGMTQNQVRAEFGRLDREVVALRGQQCAARIAAESQPPRGSSGVRVDERTEMELLQHLINLQRPRTPIRQLMKRAGRAIQELKPCFMMGPLSVAQFLEPGSVQFDLVIMDEASQLKPEEAIGAIARGGQLVVVGDPKQLPPTSFFDRMMSVQDEGDDSQASVATSSESVLDLCIPVFPHRTLKWHYRSQHESLIAFSNARFYDRQLFVFPSPYPKTKHLGLRYHYIRDGVYQNRQNFPEARRVVDAVVEHMQARPNESLGVVTLNITQRDLIEELLEQRLRSFEPGEEYRARWEEEGWPFFVKNLENVQGDERDAIYISTTFGKAPGASVVHQNFGPINKDGGWRRLNVLFTRAKKSVHVYSSMQPEDIVLDTRTPKGTVELRNYLEYASRGVLEGATIVDRPPDSDFEISVMNVLTDKGYEVRPQLGVANFFIDLAVRNPDRRGEFMAAIECDGATYHSGVSVRDRDRIRQEILESLGWKGRIWRIWSTDWFRSPKREIERLLGFLEERRQASAQEVPAYYDEVGDAHPEIEASAVLAQPEVLPEESQVPSLVPGVGEDEELYVEVGDKVVYIDLDAIEEKSSFTIIADGHIPSAGLINEAKPLAQAFLGAAIGETVEMKLENRPAKRYKLLNIERASTGASA